MSIFSGPEIANNGLVFSYDMGNTQKSWRGAPTVNLISNPTFSTGVISPWTYQDVANGNATIDTSVKYDGYNSARITRTSIGGESNMWLNLSAAQGLLPDTQYTFSAYSLAYSPNQASLFSYFSTTSNGSVIHSGSGQWERLVHTFTTRSTEPYVQIRMWHNTTLLNSPVWFTELQVEQKTFATPFVNGTRTTSNNLVDLTGNNTLTATSLTYASDNTFSFNGSTNHIISTNTGMSHGTGNFTYSCWVKFAGLPGLGTIFENGFYTAGILIRFETNVIRIYAQYSATTYTNAFSFTPTVGLWYHLVITRVGDNLILYSNGVLLSTITFGTSINVVPSNNLLFVGMSQHSAGQCFNGQISNASIYNRALPAKEVLQNFEALRGRYNI